MKPLLALLAVAILSAALPAPTRLTLTSESQLSISGTSSVHDWTCTIDDVDGALDVTYTGETLQTLNHVTVTVQADAIACKNRTMNRKTRAALNAKAHPSIVFELTAAEITDAYVQISGNATVAGTTQPLMFRAEAKALGPGRFRFTGEVPLLMSDFGIKPPTAMLGTLKTGDAITIAFDVVADA
ncbi:MAG: hypothetical protein RhofKO_09380 [Rhodothermales bacterium]